MNHANQANASLLEVGNVSVAKMTLDDHREVAILFDAYRGFYGKSQDIELARRFIRERFEFQDSWILVARNGNGVIAGFCQIYPSFSSVSACRIGILNDLFVSASERSQGIGSALLEAARTLAAALGLARLELSTAYDNHPAHALYERHGWAPDSQFVTYRLAIDQADPAF